MTKRKRDRSVTRRHSDTDRVSAKPIERTDTILEEEDESSTEHSEGTDDETMKKIPPLVVQKIEKPVAKTVERTEKKPMPIASTRKSPLMDPVMPAPRAMMDDDRPTEVYDRTAAQRELVQSRDQIITGSTIREMMNNPKHKLSQALTQLLKRARADLPAAEIDARASLLLRHDFEFERRVGYQLKLKLFDASNKCVEVVAELDQDGRAIRRGSVFSKLIDI